MNFIELDLGYKKNDFSSPFGVRFFYSPIANYKISGKINDVNIKKKEIFGKNFPYLEFSIIYHSSGKKTIIWLHNSNFHIMRESDLLNKLNCRIRGEQERNDELIACGFDMNNIKIVNRRGIKHHHCKRNRFILVDSKIIKVFRRIPKKWLDCFCTKEIKPKPVSEDAIKVLSDALIKNKHNLLVEVLKDEIGEHDYNEHDLHEAMNNEGFVSCAICGNWFESFLLNEDFVCEDCLEEN